MDNSGKPYQLTLEERPQYLYARIEADTINRESALAYLREVADKCAALNTERLMLERHIHVMLSDVDLFNTTTDFLEMIRGIKAAFVNPYVPINEDMDFAMIVGVNRGADYKLFDNVATAEKWLLQGGLPVKPFK